MITEQTFFTSGDLWGVGSDVLSTPTRFGTLNDVSVDFSFSEKELRGQNLFAEKIARSEGKITGKAKFGRIDPITFNLLFFNGALTTGRERTVSRESGAVAAATPWIVTVANAATFKTDLGVTDATTGQKFEKVAAGGEAVGEYSVDPSTGIYTFSTADAGRAVLVSYVYTDVTGHTIAVTNTAAGIAPNFEIILRGQDDDGEFGLKLYACTSSKLTLATKLGDYMLPEFDFSASANAAGDVADIWTE